MLALSVPAIAEDASLNMSLDSTAAEMLPCGSPALEPTDVEPTFFDDASFVPAANEPDQSEPSARVELATKLCNPWVVNGCCLNNRRLRRLCSYGPEYFYEYQCTTAPCAF